MKAETETKERITTRIPTRIRETLEDAAALAGAPLNQFIVQAAYQEAQRMLETETRIRLSREEAKRIFKLMENPPAPNAKLRRAWARANKLQRSED